jgi:hypothetical protein
MRKSVLLAVAGATLAGAISSVSPADAVVYKDPGVGGKSYNVTTLTGTFNDLSVQLTAANNALWHDQGLANRLADVVGGNEGIWNESYGPFFAYNDDAVSTVYAYAYSINSGGIWTVGSRVDQNITYATATAVPWETDALPVIGSTILFAGGLWARNKFAKPLQK